MDPALSSDRSPNTSAAPRPEQTPELTVEPTAHAATLAPVDAARAAKRARALAKLAKKAKVDARIIQLFTRNHCWQGEAPAGVVPGHAVVTLPGAMPALVPADVGYGIWIDGDPGELHAFCL
jgi:hypothetical protein